MSLTESIHLALASLRSNKLRSALTLLGVIIGIAAVISILTLGAALKKQTLDSLDQVGASNFSVEVKPRNAPPEEASKSILAPANQSRIDPADMITPTMIEKLREKLEPDLRGIAVGETDTVNGEFNSADEQTTAAGKALLQLTNPDFIELADFHAVAGRLLIDDDIDSQRHVTVIPTKLAEEMFGSPSAALGKDLTFTSSDDGRTIDVRVVGVYAKPKSGLLMGDDSVNFALSPYPLNAQLSDTPGAGEAFTAVSVRASSSVDKAEFGKRLTTAMDSLYANNLDVHAQVSDSSEQLNELNQVFSTMSMALAAIGGISLLVGGIGVMNIMLITVTERTREIGVRKALGARRRDIRLQFVIEAIIVCLIGGLLGVALGGIGGMLGSVAMGTFTWPPLSGVLISLLFSLAVGLFFGYYPAGKAAKLDPIAALRYE